MKKILIISSELPPIQGEVVTGVGLRMHGIEQGLVSYGMEVIYAIAHKRINRTKNVPERFLRHVFTPGTLKSQIEKINPDAVIKIWWGEEDQAFEGLSIPVLFDLPAPRLMEDIYHARHTGFQFREKVRSFENGDFFTCPSELHKAYYLPTLLMSGADVKKNIIDVVPHPITPYEGVDFSKRDDFGFIFGGVFWPWQNPVPALNTLIDALNEFQKGSLKIFGGTLPVNDNEKRAYFNPLPMLNKSTRLQISGLLPYNLMKEEFSKAMIGVDVMEKNSERDISFSFRTLEYLSCGLPVIVNNNSEWGRIIEKHEAGWIVNPEDKSQMRKTIENILTNREQIAKYSENAKKLIREHFNPEMAIAPILNFCNAPFKRESKNFPMRDLLSMEAAITYRKKGMFNKSLDELELLTNGDYTHEWIYFERAVTLIEWDKLQEAEAELINEERLYPGKSHTKNSLGIIYKRMKRYAEALKCFKEAVIIDPCFYTAKYNLCSTYALLGSNDEAKIGFEEIFCDELAPQELRGGSSFHLGNIYKSKNNNLIAQNFFRKCLEFIPDHKEAGLALNHLTTRIK